MSSHHRHHIVASAIGAVALAALAAGALGAAAAPTPTRQPAALTAYVGPPLRPPVVTPPRPTTPTVVPAPATGAIRVSWEPAPATTGGVAPQRFVASTATGASCSAAPTSTSCTITGLALGRRYAVRVVAVGDGLAGVPTHLTALALPAIALGPPAPPDVRATGEPGAPAAAPVSSTPTAAVFGAPGVQGLIACATPSLAPCGLIRGPFPPVAPAVFERRTGGRTLWCSANDRLRCSLHPLPTTRAALVARDDAAIAAEIERITGQPAPPTRPTGRW